MLVADDARKLGRLVHHARIGQPDGSADRRQDLRHVTHCREVDEDDARLERHLHIPRSTQRQARLADTARPEKREQAHLGVGQQGGYLTALLLPPDEARGLGRQGARRAVIGTQRLRDLRQVGVTQLVEALGPTEVLEAVLAEVVQGDVIGQAVDDQRCRGG